MSVAKAHAAMTSPLSTPSPHDNLEPFRQSFFDQCEQFGSNAGAGDTSKVGWFQATCEAAWQGYVSPGARRKPGDPPNDAEIAYTRYANARQKKAGELGRKLQGADPKNTDYRTRVNEANTMIKLGSMPIIHDTDQGGLGVFNRTLQIIRTTEEIKGQVDDMLLNIARAQFDKPDVPLNDDEIRQVLIPEKEDDKPPTPEVELWGNVMRQIESIMHKKFPETSGTSQDAKTALNATIRQIDKLGGTAAMAKARAKAAEKDAKDKAARQVQRQGARKGKKK
jgi:hypothetical protein